MQDTALRDGAKQPPGEPKTAGPLPHTGKQRHVEDDEIHSYIRVQILGITFRISQTAPLNNGFRTQNIVVSHPELEDMDILSQLLTENFHLSEEDCRAAISHRRQIASTSNSHASREYGAKIETKFRLRNQELEPLDRWRREGSSLVKTMKRLDEKSKPSFVTAMKRWNEWTVGDVTEISGWQQ